jgi:hypothetical protein
MIKKSFVYLMLLAVAAVLLLVNLYLWHLERNTQHRIADLQQQVGLHLRENKQLNDRNDALRIDVENLRSPDSYYSYEEKAREDYGMIGKNETYFVLPDSEIASIPDIPGLAEKEQRYKPGAAVLPLPMDTPQNRQQLVLEAIKEENASSEEGAVPAPVNKNVEQIPVVPIPLKLESAQ